MLIFYPIVTISLPCYKRPLRTIRAIESVVMQQTVYRYQLLITGDNCPCFNEDSFQKDLRPLLSRCLETRNDFSIKNNSIHTGGYGYEIRNQHIKDAQGAYFMFMGSDDVLQPNHLQDKLQYIHNTLYDWIYFDTYVEPNNAPRNAQLKPGMIGHSELLIKTSYLQTMPPHSDRYGHDWELVQHLMAGTAAYIKAPSSHHTYIVKSIPGREEQGID